MKNVIFVCLKIRWAKCNQFDRKYDKFKFQILQWTRFPLNEVLATLLYNVHNSILIDKDDNKILLECN